jgi:chemotaxis protein methyltransferase CheR
MPSYDAPPELSETTFLLLRELIQERLGWYLEEEKRALLAGKLLPLVLASGQHSFLGYYFLLKNEANADAEWLRVINHLAIQETYFWREFEQVQAVAKVLVPQFFSSRRSPPLRIWSAACASGEEPLTIAMALEESAGFQQGPIEIHASDASPTAIERARQGRYRERSLRYVPILLRARYFAPEGELWKVSPQLHGRIAWRQANLLAEEEVAGLASAHIIFCRNVFSYFSAKTIRRTAQLFYRYMGSPGYLFVGTSESLAGLDTGFELREIGRSFVYVKR